VVDDSQTYGPDFTMRLFAPNDDDQPTDNDPAAADVIYEVISALPDPTAANPGRCGCCAITISAASSACALAGRIEQPSGPRRR
jgi:hypothetical protein